MTDKEAFLKQKREEVSAIFEEQRQLVIQSTELLKNASNQADVFPIVLQNCFKIRLLETQKQIILSRPFPKKEWPHGGIVVQGELCPESINFLPKKSTIFPKEGI